MAIDILEHSSPKYTPRTYHNAKTADLTVAFAVDFSTAGEKCTHKAAGEAYVSIPLQDTPLYAARTLWKACKRFEVKTLNVAGNGLYTLHKYAYSQQDVNAFVLEVITTVHQHWPIQKIISGGQTGVDIAGIVAANVLGIDAVAMLPKGYIQRGIDKVDKEHTREEILQQIISYSEMLR